MFEDVIRIFSHLHMASEIKYTREGPDNSETFTQGFQCGAP